MRTDRLSALPKGSDMSARKIGRTAAKGSDMTNRKIERSRPRGVPPAQSPGTRRTLAVLAAIGQLRDQLGIDSNTRWPPQRAIAAGLGIDHATLKRHLVALDAARLVRIAGGEQPRLGAIYTVTPTEVTAADLAVAAQILAGGS